MAWPHDHVRDLVRVYDHEQASAAHLLCDRHTADTVAFTVIEADLTSRDLTFGELRERSERFAGALAELGVGQGDRVATLMGKSAELIVALLGIWRLGAVHVPLFTAFAPAAIALRITGNGTKVVIADGAQCAKVEPSTGLPADDERRLIVTGQGTGGALSFDELIAASKPWTEPVALGGSGVLIELFTSGTTGAPKAVPVPVRALAGFQSYQEFALDLRDDDVFWNAADPGWAYGLYYAITAPLATGRRSLLLRAGFSAELTWAVLSRFGVTNFAAAPTVYRALRNASVEVPGDLRLRHCSSAGEPLTPDVLEWASGTIGVGVYDHYGQTELGMVVGNAWHPGLRAEVKPGSMGRVLPGFAVEVLRADADVVARPGERGRVALERQASPLFWFTGYRDAPDRTAARFSPDGRWYYTGDVAAKDADGYLTFASRDDDVILMAGYRIGPFDVESVLEHHPAVAESAVIGVPDPVRGEVIVAYVVLREGFTADDDLVAELRQFVKTRFAAHAYPRQVHFVPDLPKTPSGKIQRFLLRRRHSSAS